MDGEKGVAHFAVAVIIIAVAAIGFLLWRNLETRVTDSSVSAEQAFISPFRLSPFVTQSETKETICTNASLPIISQLCEKYPDVLPDSREEIDELILVLRETSQDSSLSDYDKYLVSQLVFSLLPDAENENKSMSFIPQVKAQTIGISQEEYAGLLAEDLTSVLENCPAQGYENWVINASCSVYSWIDREMQPIYSKMYGEVGGPCAFSDAGAVERYHTYSIVNSKMSSEQNFIDATGVSSQIACSFNCGSYNCPKSENDLVNSSCTEKGSTNIYVMHPRGDEISELTDGEILSIAETASTECKERSYDYIQNPDGTTSLDEARDCKLLGRGEQTSRYDADTGKWSTYTVYCCSCARPERDPYVSIYDFTEPDFSGEDLLQRLLDLVRGRLEDTTSTPQTVPDTTSEPDTTPDTPAQPGGDSGEEIVVLVIGGQHYPIDQFVLAEPDECDSSHWHAYAPVTSLEGTSASDPNPSGCGFGKESEIPVIEVTR